MAEAQPALPFPTAGSFATYRVGGAVRDRLLGRAPGDEDFVVVGASQAAMHALGFRAVGRDFPVFLHPQTHAEYALARTERKSGRGYRGFVVDADPSVTLEDDLRRRDLTINAIAEDAQGRIIDPFGGRADLQARVLRHVSPAFVEDPVRVLRIARFAARFAGLGFTVAPETQVLMRAMVADGELDHLVPERVWAEMERALGEATPSAFLRVLRDCGALAVLLPEVDRLYGVPQRAEYHPEVDTGRHQELVSDMAAQLAPGDSVVGYAALLHDLGKGATDPSLLPSHIGHEHAGVPLVDAVNARLKVSREHGDLARLVCRHHLECHRALELRPTTIVDLLGRLDAFRRPERFRRFLLACEADKRGREGFRDHAYPQAQRLARALEAASAVDARALAGPGLDGPAIADRVRSARVAAVAALAHAGAR
ncbi:multifunctional CCA addition/repair protein [Pseudofulvimonas gallinarii]|jgi:tRNA nucleotidyltransferase (CCA-adding enzyme)|uniref:Multifunctional CCA protein n=1 Tax=Pseudofulvimonas gallinarii TaxID=634155 RepID=A0A4R3LHA3_9GAMM|nr:multifunctional CCA addition/repair protein [Pseudofulvimonas gallinarii]TCS98875.1 tRNA nucleotidyltransferase (CCA-adding enzyme) [Pseudofulvimonas gallinarii]THD14357.1 multifunctional CCA tRNA nucleotidyl transferase/2'3'-cyclic phosphodiesterase/2'nucleotidase/phosphatase [Pseudofulvimonas gallinarii]